MAAIAALPYLNGLHGDFVFDDVPVIRDNPAVQQAPPHHLLTAVHHPGALYRPLTMLTYAANARLSNDPFAYHVVNVALHATVTVAAYLLARHLLASQTTAVVAALLFAVHPCHTEAVTSIVGRAEVLAALLSLTALLAFRRAIVARGWSGICWWIISLGGLGAGLLAKESAFTTIALIPALHWHLLPHAGRARRVRVMLPYLAVGLAYVGLRLAVVGSIALPAPPNALDNPLAHVALSVRLATALVVLLEYASLIALPRRLTADYSFNEVPLVMSPSDPRFVIAAMALGSVGALIVAGARRLPGLAESAWFSIAPLALTANLLFPIGTIKAERLLYFPSFGCCLVVAASLAAALQRHPRVFRAVMLFIVLSFASRTWARNYDWQDSRSLFEATVLTSSQSAKAHYNAGVAYQERGQLDQALAHYRRALQIYPSYAWAAFGIGRVYSLRGNDPGALLWYDEALRRDWRLTEAHLNVGLIHERQFAYTRAEAAFRTGLLNEPANAILLVNLSAVRLAQGDRWGALSLLDVLDRVPLVARDAVEVVAGSDTRTQPLAWHWYCRLPGWRC